MGTQTVLVTVTEKHLEKHECFEPTHCAVAQAVAEKLQPRYQPHIFNANFWIEDREAAKFVYDSEFPAPVAKFIADVDHMRKVELPFSFEIQLPPEILR